VLQATGQSGQSQASLFWPITDNTPTQRTKKRRLHGPVKSVSSLYQWREVLRCRKRDHSPNSAACECRWNRMSPWKAHCNASAASALDTRSETAVTHPGASRVGLPSLRWLLYTAGTAPVLWLRGKPHGEKSGLCEVERGEGRACKAGARPWPKERRHSPPYCSERTAGRAICRADGPGREVESRRSRGVCCQDHNHTNRIPNSTSQPVTEASEKPKVTANRKTARPQKSEPKATAAPKLAAGKSKKKTAASVKTAAAKHTARNLVVPNPSSTSPLEEISDLLDHLPLHACVELTRRLLTSISSLPTGAARPRAVLKTVILFVAEYGSTP
jgi:hypothetical protein